MLVYCVNIWHHHNWPICRELFALLGDEFKMVLFTPCEDTGYGTDATGTVQPWIVPPPDEPWIVAPPRRVEDLKSGIWNRLLESADVAIVGYNSYMSRQALRNRERSGKITFFMGERFFKTQISWKDFLNPRQVKRWIWLHNLLRGRHTYYLEMSHDGWRDLRFLRVCKNRTFKWSYFPPVSAVCPQKMRDSKLHIGWCGRMIDWKHVEYIIKAIGLLQPDVRQKCVVNLIGNGPCRADLVELAERLGVKDIIHFENYKPINEIADFMRDLDVYVFPSDRGEGWGVALMEAMDKGCVPIANVDAGSTLDLVRDGENGFVFENGDVKMLAHKIQWVVEHRSDSNVIGENAWRTIQQWSPRRGAEMLLKIVETVKSGRVQSAHLPRMGLGSLIDFTQR